jgi:hypothetical protein
MKDAGRVIYWGPAGQVEYTEKFYHSTDGLVWRNERTYTDGRIGVTQGTYNEPYVPLPRLSLADAACIKFDPLALAMKL